MIHKIARYTVKHDQVDAAEEAVREFVRAVSENEPDTVYRAFRQVGTRAFLHVMAFPDERAEERHRTAPYTRSFVERLYPRCEAEPAFEELAPVA